MIKSNTDYENQVFKEINQTQETFDLVTFVECTFVSCDFTESKFVNCRFEDCSFRKCNLSNGKYINSNFIGCKFEGTKMIGIDFTLIGGRLGLILCCKKCDLSYTNFMGVNISKSVFTNCDIKESDLTQANAEYVVFDECDFEKTIVFATDLKNSLFTHCINYAFNPAENRVKGAKFTRENVHNLLLPFGVIIIDD
jgi:fluoroquinolone resistance protein